MRSARDKLRVLDGLESPDLWQRARSLKPSPRTEVFGSKPGAGRLTAAVVAIAVFIFAAVFAYQAFGPGAATSPGDGGAFGPVACSSGPPPDAIAVVSCDGAAEQAMEVATFVTATKQGQTSWRDWPIGEGWTVGAWLVTYSDAEYQEGVGGCSTSGTLTSYTVVISATSGKWLASDGPPEGCTTDQSIAPVVNLPSDSCSLVTSDEVAEATSSKVISTRQLDASDMKVPLGPPYPCDYQTDGRFGQILVQTKPNDPGGFDKALNQDRINSQTLSGLGDGAFIFARSVIVVAVGDGSFAISVQQGSGPDAEAALKQLASDALLNLSSEAGLSEQGVITGTLALVGGPNNTRTPVSGEMSVMNIDQTGPIVFNVDVGPDGSFSTVVAPGTYQVVGISPQYSINNGQGTCAPTSAHGTVTVAAGEHVNVDVECQMK